MRHKELQNFFFKGNVLLLNFRGAQHAKIIDIKHGIFDILSVTTRQNVFLLPRDTQICEVFNLFLDQNDKVIVILL